MDRAFRARVPSEKRLGQKRKICIVAAVMNNRIRGVPRNIENAQLGIASRETLRELHAAAARKYDVGEQQVDWVRAVHKQLARVPPSP